MKMVIEIGTFTILIHENGKSNRKVDSNGRCMSLMAAVVEKSGMQALICDHLKGAAITLQADFHGTSSYPRCRLIHGDDVLRCSSYNTWVTSLCHPPTEDKRAKCKTLSCSIDSHI